MINFYYLYLFFQSNGLEILFILLYFKVFPSQPSYRFWNWVLCTTLINSITHPIVVFLFLKAATWNYLTGILVAEFFAFAIEAAVYHCKMKLPLRTALIVSFLANLVSWQLGPILTTLIFLK